MGLGWPCPAPDAGVSINNLNSATAGSAFCFQVPQNETLSKVKIYYGATGGGTPTAAGSKCSLCADSSGTPNTGGAIAAGVPPTPLEIKQLAAYTASAVNEWTGFTTALTANTNYWIVLTNATATQASNFQTVQRINVAALNGSSDPAGLSVNGGAGGWGFGYKSTTDGSSWNTGGNNPVNAYGVRLEFASGRFLGAMFTNAAVDTTNEVYAARRYGVMFTTPSTWPSIKISSMSMQVTKAGTVPSSGFRYQIFGGSTSVPTLITNGTSATLPAANFAENPGWYRLNFPTSPTLAPNTIYHLLVGTGDATAGSAANAWRFDRFVVENDANSKAQLPFGSLQMTYSTDGTNFTQTATDAIPFMLWLDDSGEFSVPAAGGIKNQNLVSGGAQ